MIRKEDDRQLTFILPFGGRLSSKNRWVKLSRVIPWGDLEPTYNAVMNMKKVPIQTCPFGDWCNDYQA